MDHNLALEEQENQTAVKESPKAEVRVNDPKDHHDPKREQGLTPKANHHHPHDLHGGDLIDRPESLGPHRSAFAVAKPAT